MSAREFCDDDAGYLAWLAIHPDGYVINIARSHNVAEARVHHSDCRTISGQAPRAGTWTGPYVKVCAEDLAEIEQWALDHVMEPIPLCGTCHRAGDAARRESTAPTSRAVAGPASGGRFEVEGPAAGRAVVEAWCDDYIRFPPRPLWQEHLTAEIQTRCYQLKPSAKQVLHAAFFGAKPANADVENLALYNVGTFNTVGHNGIRFEHGTATPLAPDGVKYRVCYRYALAPRSGAFIDWQEGPALAAFDWTDLGSFVDRKRLAQVWLALARAQLEVGQGVYAPETPFGVKVHVRPPRGRARGVSSDLVKPVFDGVICAFQAHSDTTVLPEAAVRLAAALPAGPVEIEERLLDRRRAVLGVVPRLVSLRGAGVQWYPADHLCVAGELLCEEPIDSRWAIKGELVELSRWLTPPLSVTGVGEG